MFGAGGFATHPTEATPMTTTKYRPPYTVRKQASGYSGSVRWYVYCIASGSRVSVHASLMRDTAQAEADRLNVIDLCPDADADPRPFDVRYAEARSRYEELVGRKLT
jgi:hypothetical protein